MAGRGIPGQKLNGRFFQIIEGIGVALAIAAILGMVSIRDDVIKAHDWATVIAPAWHTKAEGRLDYLERPEALVQFAQAHDAVNKVEEAHKIAAANAATIRVIQKDIEHAKEGAKRREGLLNKIADKLDKMGEK